VHIFHSHKNKIRNQRKKAKKSKYKIKIACNEKKICKKSVTHIKLVIITWFSRHTKKREKKLKQRNFNV